MMDITVVITSCGRIELLKRTLTSLLKFANYKIKRIIIIEDDPEDKYGDEIESYLDKIGIVKPSSLLIRNTGGLGQIKAIDFAYQYIDTEYFLHCENDWEFYRGGFIEKSLAILEADPKIITVWLRDLNDTNGHPIDKESYCIYNTELSKKITDYHLMSLNALGGNWHGFTWNPGLRRLSDYELVKPFSQFIQPGDFAALTECRIGLKYLELGFRAAILPDGYCKHIG